MKWLAISLPLVLLLLAVPASAEVPGGTGIQLGGTISPGEITPTPEMWFYEQYLRQYQDPKAMVRKKAEFRTAQRQRRLAARRWFGFSNIRPTASPDPYNGDYSPHWASNNYFNPFQWNGVGPAAVAVRPTWWLTY